MFPRYPEGFLSRPTFFFWCQDLPTTTQDLQKKKSWKMRKSRWWKYFFYKWWERWRGWNGKEWREFWGQGSGGEKRKRKVKKEEREIWRFYKFGILGLKWVLEKGFEAFSNANLMKMSFRSDWDTSRGLKPPKMVQKCDFARIFFSLKKILLLFQIGLIPRTNGRAPCPYAAAILETPWHRYLS